MENNEKEDSLMKFNLLINQLDEHNEVGILLAQKYKIKSVVMLYRNKEKKKLDKFKELYLDLNRIEVIDELIEEDNYDNLKNIISFFLYFYIALLQILFCIFELIKFQLHYVHLIG